MSTRRRGCTNSYSHEPDFYDDPEYEGQPLPDFAVWAAEAATAVHPDGIIAGMLEEALNGTSLGGPSGYRFVIFAEYVERGMHLRGDGKRKTFKAMAGELSGLALPGTLSKWLKRIEAEGIKGRSEE
jgi:hypothetical protein